MGKIDVLVELALKILPTTKATSIWLTIACYTIYSTNQVLGLAVFKLYAVDMVNAETSQKVIVLMILGALMLVSAFLFMRFTKEKKEL